MRFIGGSRSRRALLRCLAAGLLACVFAGGLAAARDSAGDAALARKLDDAADGRDWAAYGRSYGEQHFSPLADVDTSSVGRLGLAWSLDLPVRNSATVPLAVDGVLYFATGYSVVHALRARDGRPLWEYDPHAPEQAGQKLRAAWGTRGLAYWNGKVYTATVDGRLIALDARTGRPVWTAATVAPGDGLYVTGPPRAFAGKVIIGNGGADTGAVRGYVTTYDAETGRRLWRFYTVPGDPAVPDGEASDAAMAFAARTWAGRWWEKGGGGTVWNAITYDPEFDTVLLGTGNGSPWSHRVRSLGIGDNLFLCSMVAVDAKTGAYKWHYQFNPGETWDYNAAMDMALATLEIDGAPRKVVMTAPKNGFFYVIDRANGKLLSAEPHALTTWATRIDLDSGRPVETPDARYPDGKPFLLRPSPSGAHNWNPMAFDPQRRLVFIPTLNLAARFDDRGIDADSWRRQPGVLANAAANVLYYVDDTVPGTNTSSLLAWDPLRQRQVWRVATPGFWNGGVLATGGGLVFQGRIDGRFDAYDARSGLRLWSFDAQAPILAAPISYRVRGRQYITVLTGWNAVPAAFGPLAAPFGIDYRTMRRRVLTFALDAGATLPPVPPATPAAPAPDAGYRADAAAEGRGAQVYGMNCLLCHGVNVVAAGSAPDLRQSPVPLDAAAFDAIVRDGALLARGMPRFAELSDADRQDLRQYLRAQRTR
jgi:quinohemoprotein ethanol dehydrogenase